MCDPVREAELEPLLSVSLVSMECLEFNVFVASRGSAIQLSSLRSGKSVGVEEERDKVSVAPSLRFSAAIFFSSAEVEVGSSTRSPSSSVGDVENDGGGRGIKREQGSPVLSLDACRA